MIDPLGRMPKDCKLLNDGATKTVVIQSRNSEMNDLDHVERYVIPSVNDDIDVNRILQLLGDLGIQSIIVEGGPTTWKKFIKHDAVDAAILIQSPKDLQSGEVNTFGEGDLLNSNLVMSSYEMSGPDKITYWSRTL